MSGLVANGRVEPRVTDGPLECSPLLVNQLGWIDRAGVLIRGDLGVERENRLARGAALDGQEPIRLQNRLVLPGDHSHARNSDDGVAVLAVSVHVRVVVDEARVVLRDVVVQVLPQHATEVAVEFIPAVAVLAGVDRTVRLVDAHTRDVAGVERPSVGGCTVDDTGPGRLVCAEHELHRFGHQLGTRHGVAGLVEARYGVGARVDVLAGRPLGGDLVLFVYTGDTDETVVRVVHHFERLRHLVHVVDDVLDAVVLGQVLDLVARNEEGGPDEEDGGDTEENSPDPPERYGVVAVLERRENDEHDEHKRHPEPGRCAADSARHVPGEPDVVQEPGSEDVDVVADGEENPDDDSDHTEADCHDLDTAPQQAVVAGRPVIAVVVGHGAIPFGLMDEGRANVAVATKFLAANQRPSESHSFATRTLLVKGRNCLRLRLLIIQFY